MGGVRRRGGRGRVTFAYDYLNRWISTEVDTTPGTAGGETSEYFVYGQATLPDEVAPWDRAATDARDIGQITLRLDDSGEISNRYLWGPAVDQILADEQVHWDAQAAGGAGDTVTDQILWPLADHQRTVRDLAKVNGSGVTEIVNTRTYDAYGNLLAETAPAVDHLFGFTGRPTEGETGLQNNLNRWYDPEVGTWLNEDPIGFEGGDANLYRYCGNDPVNSVDPGGLAVVRWEPTPCPWWFPGPEWLWDSLCEPDPSDLVCPLNAAAKPAKVVAKPILKRFFGGAGRVIKKAAPELVVNALKKFPGKKFVIDGKNFLLDKSGLKHILERHHPKYWNGTAKATQSFFPKNMPIEEVEKAIAAVLKQNKDEVAKIGELGTGQIEGVYNGVRYVLGLNKGRIGQFYPVP